MRSGDHDATGDQGWSAVRHRVMFRAGTQEHGQGLPSVLLHRRSGQGTALAHAQSMRSRSAESLSSRSFFGRNPMAKGYFWRWSCEARGLMTGTQNRFCALTGHKNTGLLTTFRSSRWCLHPASPARLSGGAGWFSRCRRVRVGDLRPVGNGQGDTVHCHMVPNDLLTSSRMIIIYLPYPAIPCGFLY